MLVLAFLLALCPAARAKHRVTFDDLSTLTSIGQVELSPDGKMLAYTTYNSTSSQLGDLWIISTKPASAPRKIGEGMIPAWSPDSRSLSYYSGISGSLQLWVVHLPTSQKEQVTFFKGGIDTDPMTRLAGSIYDAYRVSWSPDNTHIVFATHGPATARGKTATANTVPIPRPGAPLVLTNRTPPAWTLSGVFASELDTVHFKNGKIVFGSGLSAAPPVFNQLFVVDVKHHVVKQLTHDRAGYFSPSWSPDGKNIAYASNEERLWGETATTTNVYVLNIASSASHVLTHGSDSKTLPVWSPNGQSIAFWNGQGFGPWSVCTVPSMGGNTLNVTSLLNRGIEEFQWSSDGKSVIVSYQDGATITIGRITVASKKLDVLSGPKDAERQSITVSHSGLVAWNENNPSSPGLIRIVSAEGTSVNTINLNPEVANWELGQQEVIHWKNHRGDTLDGILIKPVGYRASQHYPLIVDGYPGEVNSFRSSPMGGNQAWASMGYVLFWPNPRAPHFWVNPTRDKAFDEAGKGPEGVHVMVDDTMSGVDELIRLGIVDPDRMCVYGFSNGGGVVDQLVTETGRFKCAVSVAGVLPDWSSIFFLDSQYAKEFSDFAGFTPWENPYGYVALSPVYRLNKVTTPMLLADGDDDGSFLLGTIEMYNGLRFLGKDVTFIRYPNQGHGFTGAAMKDFWNRENLFLASYLKP